MSPQDVWSGRFLALLEDAQAQELEASSAVHGVNPTTLSLGAICNASVNRSTPAGVLEASKGLVCRRSRKFCDDYCSSRYGPNACRGT